MNEFQDIHGCATLNKNPIVVTAADEYRFLECSFIGAALCCAVVNYDLTMIIKLISCQSCKQGGCNNIIKFPNLPYPFILLTLLAR